MTGETLAGAAVLVTRPVAQAGELVAAIESAGGTALAFPVLKIAGREPRDIQNELGALPKPDIVIFTSANAVRFGLPQGLEGSYGGTRIAAIGPATRRALEGRGCTVGIGTGGGFTSEQLLATRELQDVASRNVRIVRGVGGRELLAETLRQRGANVDYLQVYLRSPERHDERTVERVGQRWLAGGIDAVVVMSVESFDGLWALLAAPVREAMRRTPLVTPSERVIQTIAEKIPGSPAILAKGPQAADMLRALIHAIAPGIRDEPET